MKAIFKAVKNENYDIQKLFLVTDKNEYSINKIEYRILNKESREITRIDYYVNNLISQNTDITFIDIFKDKIIDLTIKDTKKDVEIKYQIKDNVLIITLYCLSIEKDSLIYESYDKLHYSEVYNLSLQFNDGLGNKLYTSLKLNDHYKDTIKNNEKGNIIDKKTNEIINLSENNKNNVLFKYSQYKTIYKTILNLMKNDMLK